MSQENDIQSCRRLLNEIAEMCDHATLTGSLSGGAKRTAQRYNTVLSRLIDWQAVPSGLFTAIPEDSEYGEIGVEARMLASYFSSNKEKNRHSDDPDKSIIIRLAPFVGKEELALLIREHASKGAGLDMNTLSSLAPFLGQDMLSDLIRSHLSKEKSPSEPAAHMGAPQTPAPPSSPAKPDYRLEPVAPQTQSIEDLLNLLKSPYLSDEERNDLVEKLRTATGR